MRVVYVAHPVRSPDVASNIQRAKRWLSWLMFMFPNIAFIAPWITMVEILGDTPHAHELGLAYDIAIVRKCDAIILVGGRVSDGMAIERDAIASVGGEVHDWSIFGEEPPSEEPAEGDFTVNLAFVERVVALTRLANR